MPDINLKLPTIPGFDVAVALLEFAKAMRETQDPDTRKYWDLVGREIHHNWRKWVMALGDWEALPALDEFIASKKR